MTTHTQKSIVCGLVLVLMTTSCLAHGQSQGFFFRALVSYFPKLQECGWSYDNAENYCDFNGIVCNEHNQVREIHLNIEKLKGSNEHVKNMCQYAKSQVKEHYKNDSHPYSHIEWRDDTLAQMIKYCNFIPSLEKVIIYDNDDQLECCNEGGDGAAFACYISGNSMPECNQNECKISFKSKKDNHKSKSVSYNLRDNGSPVSLKTVESDVHTSPVELKRVNPPPLDTTPVSLRRVPVEAISEQQNTVNYVPVGFQTTYVPIAQVAETAVPVTQVNAVPVDIIPITPVVPFQEPIQEPIPVAPIPQEPIPEVIPVAPIPQEPIPETIPIAPVPQEPIQEPIPVAPVPQEPVPQVIPVAPVPQAPIPQVIPVAPVPQAPIPQAMPVQSLERIQIAPLSVELSPPPIRNGPLTIDAIPITLAETVPVSVAPLVQQQPVVEPVSAAQPQNDQVVLASSGRSNSVSMLSYSLLPMAIASFIINFESVSSLVQSN